MYNKICKEFEPMRNTPNMKRFYNITKSFKTTDLKGRQNLQENQNKNRCNSRDKSHGRRFFSKMADYPEFVESTSTKMNKSSYSKKDFQKSPYVSKIYDFSKIQRKHIKLSKNKVKSVNPSNITTISPRTNIIKNYLSHNYEIETKSITQQIQKIPNVSSTNQSFSNEIQVHKSLTQNYKKSFTKCHNNLLEKYLNLEKPLSIQIDKSNKNANLIENQKDSDYNFNFEDFVGFKENNKKSPKKYYSSLSKCLCNYIEKILVNDKGQSKFLTITKSTLEGLIGLLMNESDQSESELKERKIELSHRVKDLEQELVELKQNIIEKETKIKEDKKTIHSLESKLTDLRKSNEINFKENLETILELKTQLKEANEKIRNYENNLSFKEKDLGAGSNDCVFVGKNKVKIPKLNMSFLEYYKNYELEEKEVSQDLENIQNSKDLFESYKDIEKVEKPNSSKLPITNFD